MHLMGTKRHSVDSKLRLKLPAEFRREFDDQVCLLPMGESLYGFTPAEHASFVEERFGADFNPRNRTQEDLRRLLNATTVELDIDSAGRICLGKVPEEYREWVKAGKQVVVVGNERRFEIWNEQSWEQMEREMRSKLQTLLYDA